jgi:hypothetical protein
MIMRKLIFSLVFIPFCCYSQTALRDDAMRAQERRQVYMQWGDWQPKAKYFLGIQTNPQHTLVWGWVADLRGAQNSKYKKGSDIRPLGPTGKQTLRLAALAQQQSITDQIVKESNEIGSMAEQEILYYSNTTAQLDPLYLLYFKKTLKPIAEFSQSNLQSECGRADIYDFLNETGVINSHIREMNILKNRLDGLFSSNIERGQRIIMYHRLLADYRSEKSTWDRHITSTKTFLDLKAKNAYNKGSLPSNNNPFNGSQADRDRQIARQVIEEARYNSL